MKQVDTRIDSFTKIGDWIGTFLDTYPNGDPEFVLKIKSQHIYNPWLIEQFVLKALNLWSMRLSQASLLEVSKRYPGMAEKRQEKHVAVIPEENIPLAGMHDLIMVLAAGHHFYAKNTNHENDLLQFITNQLVLIDPKMGQFIHWGAFPKVIDTYLVHSKPEIDGAFISYFEKKDSLIRRRKISIGILSPNDSFDDIKQLGTDIFSFFGLSRYCVRKLFIPRSFPLNQFFEAIEEFSYLYQYNRYANNYDYHKSVFMMDQIPFYDNGFLILRESPELHVPVGCLYYEYYDSENEVQERVKGMETSIQEIVTNLQGFPRSVKLGKAHEYALWEYEDHKDTMQFLLG